jgi:hypothetical protein
MASSLASRSGPGRSGVLAALITLAPALAGAQPTRISSGINHLARHEIAAATKDFQRASEDTSAQVRSVAGRWLGHVAWLIRGDSASASVYLDRALIGAADSASVMIERARLFGFEGRYRDAARMALDAMRSAKPAERRGLAARTVISSAADGAFAALRSFRAFADSVDEEVIRSALDTLTARVKRFPGRTTDALSLLTGGALVGDRRAIEQGWASYFGVMNEAIRDSLERARQRIEETPSADFGEVIAGLTRSRLYEPAALVIASQRGKQPLSDRVSDALAYGRFAHELRASVAGYYRKSLASRARPGDLDRLMNAATRELWNALRWDGPRPEFYPAAVPRELARRFSAVISIDRGLTIPELHMAHVIGSYTARSTMVTPVKSPPHLVVLDGIIDNGLDAWLLDGAAGRAGWAARDSVFEVRTAFTEAPFQAWLALTDSESVAAELERIARDSAADLDRVRDDSSGYLPGVAARIFRDGAREILDSLSRGSLSQSEQRDAFVDAMYEQLSQTTIALHESRHAADLREAVPPSGVEGEFRAKIDEVAGAGHPKLALTAILHPDIGDESAHGRANRRIMLRLIKWMRANGSSIAGFDQSTPALLQLPLLTNSQLRAAFLSMRTS